MERTLPSIQIEGTEFIIDVLREELREKNNPQNVMPITDMRYTGNNNGYFFYYDLGTKNIVDESKIVDLSYIDDFPRVEIPELTRIDPLGMAEKYRRPLKEVIGKSDLDLMIAPGSPLDLRLNKGILPTLDIAGHTFYVDLQMYKLRPKDDFRSKGIGFDQIQQYYDDERQAYVIPYNPATREFQQHNTSALTELPKDFIMVRFPHAAEMDEPGWAKKCGLSLPNFKSLESFQMHHEARILPWEETDVPMHIKRNTAEQLRPKEEYEVNDMRTDIPFRLPTDTARALPILNIHGTEFIVDVNRLELREKANRQNVISFLDMRELPGSGYEFPYSRKSKGLPGIDQWDYTVVQIPDFVELDPAGMAKKHGVPESEIQNMSDFDLMVDQTVINKLEQQQMLPTIDIAGHTFYVDLARDRLRPKDDIWSRGIIFSELEYYYSPKNETYTIPYNQKTHTFQEVSLSSKEIPKDVIVVQIPHEDWLDPIWANRRYGFNVVAGLKQKGPQLHFQSNIIPWDQTRFAETVKRNNSQRVKPDQKSPIISVSKKSIPAHNVHKVKKRGRSR